MISAQQKPIDSGFDAKSEPQAVLEGIDLSGKVAIVTGGYSGIGLETVRALVDSGARVIAPARRVDEARALLKGLIPPEDVTHLDLADVESVKGFVSHFLQQHSSLHILINNAGIMACPEMRTRNGWELQFAVNHIGHYVLVSGLLAALKNAGGARVVALSSTAHKLSGIRWDDVQFTKNYDKWKAYGQSKTAASLLAVQLDAQLKDEGVRAFGVHPGGIFTPLQRHLPQEEMVALGWLKEDGSLSELAAAGFKSPSQGAATSLWAATSSKLDGLGGVYCENCNIAAMQKEGPTARYFGVAPWAVDTEEADRLWSETEKTLAS